MKSMTLHWNQAEISNMSDSYDIIVASDWLVFILSEDAILKGYGSFFCLNFI